MGEKYKSGRDATGEHRHDDYRMYRRLIKTLKVYEGLTDQMQILFRSKYTEEELQVALEGYTGDDPVGYLTQKKDDELREFLEDVSKVESRTAHSCVVIRAHKPINGWPRNGLYKWYYYSLEEYLTEIYNKGEDFILYITRLNELVLKREDEFEYLVPVLSPGEMAIRAMRNNPIHSTIYRQEHYIIYTVMATPDLYGDARIFTSKRFKKTPMSGVNWTQNKLTRTHYKSYRKYKGEE